MSVRSVSAVAALCAAVLVAGPAGGASAPGRTERVSVNDDGVPGDRHASGITVTADGRYAAFASPATNLVPGVTNTAFDVYLRDRVAGSIERVSMTADGHESDGSSFLPSLSADGRYVAFASLARNLVQQELAATQNVFVLDRATGELQALTGRWEEDASGVAYWTPTISADGDHVAYYQNIPNPPGQCCTERQVFWHDRRTGERKMVSVAADGTPANNLAHFSRISADGQHVAFMSSASNLSDVSGPDDIFVHDVTPGRTELVSVARDGGAHNGVFADQPSISGDGRYVAFTSDATNLVPSTGPGVWDVFVRDRQTGRTERVSVAGDGSEGNDFSSSPAISADGRFVVFVSHANNLVPDDNNDTNDVFIHDRLTGVTEMVSVTPEGHPANHASFAPEISGRGQHVVFGSRATDLVDDGHVEEDQVYLRDLGPPEGLEDALLVVDGDKATFSARARFTGALIAEGTRDSSPGMLPGGDLVGASVTYRYPQAELLLRWRIADLPSVFGRGGAPGVVYGFELTSGGRRYRVTGTAPDRFMLERCDPVCVVDRMLSGTIGTVGEEARVVLPLDAVGAGEAGALTEVRAFAMQANSEATIDLPDRAIPARRVRLGVAPVEVPGEQVTLDTVIDLDTDAFSASLPWPPRATSQRLWAQACLGAACGPAQSFLPMMEKKETKLELTVEGRGPSMTLGARLAELHSPSSLIAGRTIDFYSNTELMGSDVTNTEGIATVQVPPGHRGSNRTYQAVFEGDDFYEPSSDERPGRGGAPGDGFGLQAGL